MKAEKEVLDHLQSLVKALVDDAEAVTFEIVDTQLHTVVEVFCAPAEAGKLLGRRGGYPEAIRTLYRALFGRMGKRFTFNVVVTRD